VQRWVHRPHRGFQGRRPSGQAGGVELQRVRDRQGPRVLRDDARRAQMAGSVATAAVRNVRREVRVRHVVRLDRRVPDDPQRGRRRRVHGRAGTYRRAHAHPSRGAGRVGGCRTRHVPAREHQELDVSAT